MVLVVYLLQVGRLSDNGNHLTHGTNSERGFFLETKRVRAQTEAWVT